MFIDFCRYALLFPSFRGFVLFLHVSVAALGFYRFPWLCGSSLRSQQRLRQARLLFGTSIGARITLYIIITMGSTLCSVAEPVRRITKGLAKAETDDGVGSSSRKTPEKTLTAASTLHQAVTTYVRKRLRIVAVPTGSGAAKIANVPLRCSILLD